MSLIDEAREKLNRPWMFTRLELHGDVSGNFLVAYVCRVCGSLIDWRRDIEHMRLHWSMKDETAVELAREQEEFAGITKLGRRP